MEMLTAKTTTPKTLLIANALISLVMAKGNHISCMKEKDASPFKKPEGMMSNGNPQHLHLIKGNKSVNLTNMTYTCQISTQEENGNTSKKNIEIKADTGDAYTKLFNLYCSIIPSDEALHEEQQYLVGDHLYSIIGDNVATLGIIQSSIKISKLLEIIKQAEKRV